MKKVTQKEFDKLVNENAKPAIDAFRQNGIKMSASVIKENTALSLLQEYTIEG